MTETVFIFSCAALHMSTTEWQKLCSSFLVQHFICPQPSGRNCVHLFLCSASYVHNRVAETVFIFSCAALHMSTTEWQKLCSSFLVQHFICPQPSGRNCVHLFLCSASYVHNRVADNINIPCGTCIGFNLSVAINQKCIIGY